MARELVDLKEEKNRLEIAAETAARKYRDAEETFWQHLADEQGNMKKFASDLGPGYGTIEFQRRETITSRVLDEDAAATALEELGHGDIIGRKIPKKPLNDLVRGLMKSGEPLPEGVDFHARRYVSVSRKD